MERNDRLLAGWFAKDPNTLRRVGHVLLQIPFSVERNPRLIIIADDCFQLLKIPIDRVVQVVVKSTEKLYGSEFKILGYRFFFLFFCIAVTYYWMLSSQRKSSDMEIWGNFANLRSPV